MSIRKPYFPRGVLSLANLIAGRHMDAVDGAGVAMTSSRTRPRNLPAFCPIAVALALALGLLACQQQAVRETVSLEEAKKITADIQRPVTFEAPPRSVNDLTHLLNSPAYVKADALAQLKHSASADPPGDLDDDELVEFYLRRGGAARYLGRHSQTITDANRVLELTEGNNRFAYVLLYATYDELGDYEAAARYAQAGLDAATTAGARIYSNTHLTAALGLMGDFERAADALSRAKRELPKTANWKKSRAWIPLVRAAVVRAEGQYSYYRGDYAKAERLLRQSIAILDEDIANNPSGAETTERGQVLRDSRAAQRTYSMRYLAQDLMRSQRLSEAEAVGRETVASQAGYFGRDSGQTVEGLGALTEILTEQGRFEEAARLARETIAIYERMGAERDSVTLAVARRTLADALVTAGDWDGALGIYDQIASDLAGNPGWLDRLMALNLSWAMPMIAQGRARDAKIRLLRVRDSLIARLGAEHYETAEAVGLLACAEGALGESDVAIQHFDEALGTLVEGDRQRAGSSGTRTPQRERLQFILECRLHAVSPTPTPAEIDQMFQLASVARGGRVNEALAATAARVALGGPVLVDLARREQAAQRRITALGSVLASSGGTGKSGERRRKQLLEQIALLEASRTALVNELIEQNPDYGELISPRPLTIKELQTLLAPDEALVATYTTRERTYVWAIAKNGPIQFKQVDLSRAALDETVSRLRDALSPTVETLGDIPEFDVALAHGLYRRLLEPFASVWRGAKRLIVVPHGSLATLPLTVLPTSSRPVSSEAVPLFSGYRDIAWLARTHAMATLPAVSSLRALRRDQHSRAGGKPFVGFGDPVFSPNATTGVGTTRGVTTSQSQQVASRSTPISLRTLPATRDADSAVLEDLPPLPETAEEIRSIAHSIGANQSRDVYLGVSANEATVKSLSESGQLDDYDVLSFATHGLAPGDLNGLTQPALAMSHPRAAGVDGDGLLTMEEVLGLKTNAEWVVLSACNTAAAEGVGAEAVSGLGRAFFYAGTRALLVSNWPVHSEATRALMVTLFERFAQEPDLARADGHRDAMLELIDNGEYRDAQGRVVFSYAHPIFWAPFTVYGDGG